MSKLKLTWFLLVIFISLPAQAATFNLNFYDENGLQVGYGAFSIDMGKSFCVNVAGGPCVKEKSPLLGFYAQIQEIDWGGDSPPSDRWWTSPGQGPFGKLGGISDGFWFFGEPVSGTKQLVLWFGKTTADSSEGIWNQSVIEGPNGVPVFGSGTWTATNLATPIPAALWLFSSGLSAFYFFKRKRNT